MPLVLDQRIDRSDEQGKELVGEAEIERLHGVEFESAPECGHLAGDGIPAGGNGAPVETVGRHRKDVALLLAGEEKYERFVVSEQLLDVLDLRRLGARLRGVIG